MAAVEVTVVALRHVCSCSGAIGVGLIAVGPARLPDNAVASTAAQIQNPICKQRVTQSP
jgi:hypothetical protein